MLRCQSKFYPVIFLTALLFSSSSFANQSREKLWSLITLNGDYQRMVYLIEPQLRLVTPGILFQQFLANTGIGYKMDADWQLWLGQTISQDSQDAVPGSLDEYRIWQQILWKHRWPQLGMTARTRFEERRSMNFPQWAYRLRQRVLLNKPISERFSVVVSDEVFISVNKVAWILTNTLDQNRAYIGVEQRMGKYAYLGAGYMNQFLSTANRQFDNVLVISWRVDLEHGVVIPSPSP